MKYTPEQEKAIEHSGSALLVSAAAGSGKTAVLVERTVRLLCREQNPVYADRMLIVTFTRAAASNLRAKLARRLDEEISKKPGSAHLRRQRLLLQRASICTIDAYCLKLLQENFNRLDIPPDFSTAEGALLEQLRAESLAATLEEMYEDSEFCAFADMYGKGRTDGDAAQVVLQLHDFLTSMPRPEKVLEGFAADWESQKPIQDTRWGRALLKRGLEYAECALQLAQENQADADGEEGLENYAPGLESDVNRLCDLRDVIAGGHWDKALEELRGFKLDRLQAARGYQGPVADIIKERRSIIKKIVGFLAEDVFVCTAAEYEEDRVKGAVLVKALIRAERSFDRRFMQAKIKEKMLEFSDVEQLALQLLQNEDGTPTPLAQQVSESFDQVMVDEYQDTNALQDALYACLAKPEGENLLMVGDLKQSIYGFRQAEPGIFSHKLNTYGDYGQPGSQKLFLDANFRSAPDVIGGINAIFEKILTPELGGVNYTVGEKLRPGLGDDPAAYGGYTGGCELAFVQGDVDSEAQYVAWRIRQMIDGKTPVREGETTRPARYEDICILLRSRSKFQTFANALENNGIPVYVDKTQNILQTPEVMPMASLLRVLDNPAQDIHLASVMVQLSGFCPDDLAKIRLEHPQGSFYGAVKAAKDEKTKGFVQRLERLRSLAQTLPADRLMEEIFLATGWLAAVGTMPDGAQRRENLRRFAEFAGKNAKAGLAGAVRAIDAAAQRGIEGSEQGQTKPGCVTVMTVHRSKGLEFPIVFAANLSQKFNQEDARAQVAMHREMGIGITLRSAQGGIYETLPYVAVRSALEEEALSEEMRVLYVAFTRAKDRLVLSLNNRYTQTALKRLSNTLGLYGTVYEPVLKLCKSPADWILTAALLHPGAVNLRSIGESCFTPDQTHQGEAFLLDLENPQAESQMVYSAPNMPAAQDVRLRDEICRQMAWHYPGTALQKTPAKVSVTSLVHAGADVVLSRPSFAYKKGITAAEQGTATHAFLQFANWENAQKDLQAELDRQVEKKLMLPQLREKLDVPALETFMQSQAFRRICVAQKEYREYDYITSAKLNGPQGGDTLIQGVADLVLEFQDHMEILDYKTDQNKTAEMLLEDYRDQLLLYARAISRRFPKPITKLTIYSFCLGNEVDVPLEQPGEDVLQKFQITP